MSDVAPQPQPTAPRRGPLALFRRLYGRGPLHLLGHLVVIGITAFVLSVLFQKQFAPRPWNLTLWLLGGAVLHDGVFLPAWGVLNALFARLVGASDRRPIPELLLGSPAAPASDASDGAPRVIPTSRDQQRRVPIVNYVRVPIVFSAVLFIVFAPRILDRQPQNFVNALGHAPPDFFMRWVWVTIGLVVASTALYAVRWVLAGRPAAPAAASGSATLDS